MIVFYVFMIIYVFIFFAFRNRQQRETLHHHDIPGLPWQVVRTDLFQCGGQTYLLVTDFYLACENIRLSLLFAAGDVSRGGTTATQRQKFHTDDVKSV